MEQTSDIKYEEEFIFNRGFKLFTCRWLPLNQKAKALICLCHGYAMECSIFMQGVGVKLAKAGYAVYGIDYVGHGKSEGKRCFIESFQDLVNDCESFFKSIAESEEYKDKPRFLYGESMGAAVSLLLHRKLPTYWNGAVLISPMCKIADNIKPHPCVIKFLKNTVTRIFPTWKIATKDIIDNAFKDPLVRQQIRENRYIYQGKPRLQTAYQLLQTSVDIQRKLNKVSLPFLVLHGEDDRVTDPRGSEKLYRSAASSDKTLKIYPDMWHDITYGQPSHLIKMVFDDIIGWLNQRSRVDESFH